MPEFNRGIFAWLAKGGYNLPDKSEYESTVRPMAPMGSKNTPDEMCPKMKPVDVMSIQTFKDELFRLVMARAIDYWDQSPQNEKTPEKHRHAFVDIRLIFQTNGFRGHEKIFDPSILPEEYKAAIPRNLYIQSFKDYTPADGAHNVSLTDSEPTAEAIDRLSNVLLSCNGSNTSWP